ncbi:MAG: alpha/beta hydrolase family protein [Anaerolineales bacterium]
MSSTQPLHFTATPEEGPVSAILVMPEQPAALLVLAHGAGTDMNHYFLEDLSEALSHTSVATYRYNFPYSEKGRRGPFNSAVLTATVRSAVEAAADAAPGLPLFAGGKSMGGRMTSLAQSKSPLPGVRGLVFFGFPLHPPGKPGTERADHLEGVNIPMLFIQGPLDKLALPELLHPVLDRLGEKATLHSVDQADHSFKVPRSSGRSHNDIIDELTKTSANWIKARV